MFFGFLPVVFLMALTIEALTQSDTLITWFVAPLAMLTLGAGWRFIIFRCPNCGCHFHVTVAGRLTNGRRCSHCGLERYQKD